MMAFLSLEYRFYCRGRRLGLLPVGPTPERWASLVRPQHYFLNAFFNGMRNAVCLFEQIIGLAQELLFPLGDQRQVVDEYL
jgi:hypothetical protein